MKRPNGKPDSKSTDKKKTNNKKRGGVDWLMLLAVPVLLYFAFLLVSQQVYLNQIGREKDAADSRLQTAMEINASLRKEREELNDLNNIEKVAREELGMTREGELPYSSAKKQ